MNELVSILKSRTVWAVLVGLMLTTLQLSEGIMSPDLFLLCQSILGALAIYFRVNPRQEY
jgi:hypothetical protein